MTKNINSIIKSVLDELTKSGFAVYYGETHPVSGWVNCRWITPTVTVSKLDSFDRIFGEKIPDGMSYLVSVSNTTEDDRTYSPHGEYVYLIGSTGPVMAEYDSEERHLELINIKIPSDEEWYYTNALFPFGWTDNDKKSLLEIFTII